MIALRRGLLAAFVVGLGCSITLSEMALRRPTNPETFARIRGVGAVKLERYGERFLAIIRAADDTEAA